MPNVIRINGLERIQGKIDDLEKLTAVKTALKAAGEHIKGKIAKYPPSSEANNPGSRRWYERGYGPKWRRVDGSVGGRRTSETLGRRWTIGERNNGLTVVVGNNVSYGPFVQDKERQAWFHRKRGWKTTDEVAQEEIDTVRKFVEDEINKVLERKT